MTDPRRRAPSPSESSIQSAIMDYLARTGWYVQRLNSGAMRDANGHLVRLAQPGTPDVLAFRWQPWRSAGTETTRLLPGYVRLVFIEVKRPGNRPTPRQEMKMEELSGYGARCIIATSVEDVQLALEGMP